MKYIVTADEDGKEEIFIFPKHINHDEFADAVRRIKTLVDGNPINWMRKTRIPIAAGFTDGTTCVGRSETLGIGSRGKPDQQLIFQQ